MVPKSAPKNRPASRRLRRALAEGSRVCLCHPAPGDEQDLRALREESWAFLEPWESAPTEGASPADAAWFAGFLRGARRSDGERWLLCRLSDGEILGQLSLSNIVRGAFQSAYLGYWIGAPHSRRGFMTEGLHLSLGLAFGALDLHRVEANIRPENTPSKALVERAGFRLEGYSPQYLRIAGEWCDHERWAILRP